MQFHQEMRADSDVKGLRKVGDLQPWRYPTDPPDIDLHDGAGMSLEVLAEVQVAVKALADSDRNRRVID